MAIIRSANPLSPATSTAWKKYLPTSLSSRGNPWKSDLIFWSTKKSNRSAHLLPSELSFAAVRCASSSAFCYFGVRLHVWLPSVYGAHYPNWMMGRLWPFQLIECSHRTLLIPGIWLKYSRSPLPTACISLFRRECLRSILFWYLTCHYSLSSIALIVIILETTFFQHTFGVLNSPSKLILDLHKRSPATHDSLSPTGHRLSSLDFCLLLVVSSSWSSLSHSLQSLS